MKIKILKNELVRVLNDAKLAMTGKAALQIVNNVKIEAVENEGVYFTGTNVDTTVVTKATCDIEEAGATTIPLSILLSAVSKLCDGVVEIDSDEKRATVFAGSSKFKLNTLSASDFPTISEVEEEAKLVVPQAILREAIRCTSYAASADKTRAVLNAVLFACSNGSFSVVATDGRRLSIVNPDVQCEKDFSAVIPVDCARTIGKFATGTAKEEATLRFGGGRLSVDFGKTRFFTKLSADPYPNYRQVIPQDLPVVVTLDRATLLSAIDRVNVMSDSEMPAVEMAFSANQVVVTSNTSQVGEARDVVPVKYDGEKIVSKFNPAYLLDVLKCMTSDDVNIHMGSGSKPVKITEPGVPFLAVVMPMRN